MITTSSIPFLPYRNQIFESISFFIARRFQISILTQVSEHGIYLSYNICHLSYLQVLHESTPALDKSFYFPTYASKYRIYHRSLCYSTDLD